VLSLFHEVETLSELLAQGREPEHSDAAEPDAAAQAREAAALRDAMQHLSDPDVANVILDETLYSLSGDPASLIALTGGLEQQAPREARAPLRWLQAKAYEYIGDVDAAQRAFDEAEGLDPSWPLTLLDLARYASDRGDAARALGLLRRAGIEEDSPFIEALRRYQPMPRPDMRRNAPCWCGSGRKYKACHLNNEQLPFPERAGWLYEKAREHLRTDRWPTRQIDLAEFRMRDDSEEEFIDAVFDPFDVDVLLAEGGGFQDFVLRRGRLLPEDERELAEQWVNLKRTVFQVVDVRPGQGVTLQSVVTKDRYDVDHPETGDLRPGESVCGRLLPVEGVMHCFGGLEPVPADRLEAVLDALVEQDPAALIDAVSH
jgi:tetratricopeptide (TPR) repeat protein